MVQFFACDLVFLGEIGLDLSQNDPGTRAYSGTGRMAARLTHTLAP